MNRLLSLLITSISILHPCGCSPQVEPSLQQPPITTNSTKPINLEEIARVTTDRPAPPLPGFDVPVPSISPSSTPTPPTPASSAPAPGGMPEKVEPSPGPVVAYESIEGDSTVIDSRVSVLLTIIMNVSCPAALRTASRCRPPGFTRNDTIERCGEFNFAQRTIRYNWKCIYDISKQIHNTLKLSPKLLEDSQMSFALGILAHEYGHYLDGESGLKSREKIYSLPTLMGEKLTPFQLGELWSDFVAGCVLQDAALSNTFILKAFFEGMKAEEEEAAKKKEEAAAAAAKKKEREDSGYPSPLQRLTTFEHGWRLCNGAPPRATTLELLLETLNASTPTNTSPLAVSSPLPKAKRTLKVQLSPTVPEEIRDCRRNLPNAWVTRICIQQVCESHKLKMQFLAESCRKSCVVNANVRPERCLDDCGKDYDAAEIEWLRGCSTLT